MPAFLLDRFIKTSFVFLLVITATSRSGLAQVYDPVEAKIAEVTELIDLFMKEKSIPGLVIAVGVENELIWHRGFGYADLENEIPATPEHVFRIASISKPMTSAALGILVDGGLVDLDQPIQEYVSYFPDKKYEITPRLVAGHLAGIRHYRGLEFRSNTYFGSVREAIGVFAEDSLISKPGLEYNYSSFGWNLLSGVVEESSQRPFLEFMDEFVFGPLDMTMSGPELEGKIKGPLASFYNLSGGVPTLAPEVDNSIKWAGGGFVSTSEDVVKFGMAMLSNKLIKESTFDEFTRPMVDGQGESTRYGIGWASDHFEGRKFVGHTGGAMGASSVLFMLPDSDLVLSIICNLRGVGLIDLSREIAFSLSAELVTH